VALISTLFVWQAFALACPRLLWRGRRGRPHRPTERELQPLDVLARQAADLIERNEVENALRESREQFRWLASIVEPSHDAIIGTNLDAITTSSNKSAERLFGN
jgi:PAS domain-containing protein